MSSALDPIDSGKIFLLNRDHIVSVATTGRELIITTTFGKLVVSGESETITEFRDELANDVPINLVTIPLALSATAPYEVAETDKKIATAFPCNLKTRKGGVFFPCCTSGL